MEVHLPTYSLFGGRFRFLTFINMVWQWLFFTILAVLEFQALTKKRKHELVASLCDFLYAGWTFPLGITVAALFWGLCIIDPHAIQSKEDLEQIPLWLNHYMHSFPGLSVILETFLFKHEYPTRSNGLKAVFGLTLGYTAWMVVIFCMGGIWVYPFMRKLNILQLVLFFTGAYLLVAVVYFLGEVLSKFGGFLERPGPKKDT
ncbi:predicted protein [Nematostella vectensis]|uniref:Uncharacterized protein n=2 Tax=Nematostella vectensis TaxID=45351 RepID=A7SH55_NEMVE|nr:predicted protein [Nematostella vectensis]|eukprot:XP_001629053.1 predicted protein [Nematostella vectensis]